MYRPGLPADEKDHSQQRPRQRRAGYAAQAWQRQPRFRSLPNRKTPNAADQRPRNSSRIWQYRGASRLRLLPRTTPTPIPITCVTNALASLFVRAALLCTDMASRLLMHPPENHRCRTSRLSSANVVYVIDTPYVSSIDTAKHHEPSWKYARKPNSQERSAEKQRASKADPGQRGVESASASAASG